MRCFSSDAALREIFTGKLWKYFSSESFDIVIATDAKRKFNSPKTASAYFIEMAMKVRDATVKTNKN